MLKILIAALIAMSSTAALSAPLEVAMDADFAPYSYVDSSGKPAGFYYELLTKMFEINKVDYKLNVYPWARVLSSTDDNSLDVSIPWRAKAERFEKYHMIGPFTNIGSSYYFFQKKGSKHDWKEMSDLKGKTVGVVRGFSYPAEFEKDTSMIKETQDDTGTLVKMLLAGRVDLVISDEVVFKAEMEKQKLAGKIERTGKAIETTDRYIVVPKGKTEIADRITKMFNTFKKSKEYKKIVDKYVIK